MNVSINNKKIDPNDFMTTKVIKITSIPCSPPCKVDFKLVTPLETVSLELMDYAFEPKSFPIGVTWTQLKPEIWISKNLLIKEAGRYLIEAMDKEYKEKEQQKYIHRLNNFISICNGQEQRYRDRVEKFYLQLKESIE